MTTTDTPTREAVADILDKAADAIHTNGWFKRYLYDTTQHEGGTAIHICRVDILGAINLAIHGTPRYVGGNPLTASAEWAVRERIDVDVDAWCDLKGNGGQQAIALLRETAASLRGEVAA
jgi:hypothetical protein